MKESCIISRLSGISYVKASGFVITCAEELLSRKLQDSQALIS